MKFDIAHAVVELHFVAKTADQRTNTQASTIEGRRLIGPFACDCEFEKSKVMSSPFFVMVTAKYTPLSISTPSSSI